MTYGRESDWELFTARGVIVNVCTCSIIIHAGLLSLTYFWSLPHMHLSCPAHTYLQVHQTLGPALSNLMLQPLTGQGKWAPPILSRPATPAPAKRRGRSKAKGKGAVVEIATRGGGGGEGYARGWLQSRVLMPFVLAGQEWGQGGQESPQLATLREGLLAERDLLAGA